MIYIFFSDEAENLVGKIMLVYFMLYVVFEKRDGKKEKLYRFNVCGFEFKGNSNWNYNHGGVFVSIKRFIKHKLC